MKKDMRRLFGIIFCFFFLASGTSLAATFSYDFNNLTGNDIYVNEWAPNFENLNGQDGWTSQGFPPGLIMGVTNTSGFDGTKALRFENIGSGYGADASHLRTTSFTVPVISGFEPTIILQGDLRVGAWSNILRFAYDANSNGVIRQTDPAEIGPGLDIGTVPGVLVWSATGTPSSITLASLNISGGDWVRLRLEIDPMGQGQGVGRVYYQNLTDGDIALQPVAALQNVNMQFNWSSAGVTNPSLWDSVYLHMEGAGNGFDNLYLAPVGPDLIVSSIHRATALTTLSGVRLLKRLLVNYSVMNQGTWDSVPSELDFYLSRDKTLSQDDFYAGTADIPGLAPGEEASGSKNFLLPTPRPSAAGIWYVLGVADADDDNEELDETNNVTSANVFVRRIE